MQRCEACVLPGNFVSCTDDGICSFCVADDHRLTYKGELALVQPLDAAKATAKSRGTEYDCLCAISGGKDSMYALHWSAPHF